MLFALQRDLDGWTEATHSISVVYHGEWNWNARVKMHSNMLYPENQRGDYYASSRGLGLYTDTVTLWNGDVLTLVYKKWGNFWRFLSKAGMQMILLGGKKTWGEDSKIRVKTRKLSQDHRHLIVNSKELGKLFQQKLSGCGDWLNEDVKESNESKVKKFYCSFIYGHLNTFYHFKNLPQTNDLFCFIKVVIMFQLFIVCCIIVSLHQLGL